MDKLVLFDVNNTLTKDTKDISEYVAESIRNIYGTLVDVDLAKYEGMTAQETAEAVLVENGMAQEEIEEKLVRYTQDLFYSYYNVAGHDRQLVLDGAKELLEGLERQGVLIGMATGEAEKVARFRLEKTNLLQHFKFGAYGNEGKSAEEIVAKAVEKAKKEFSFSGRAVLVSCYPNFVKAGRLAGLATVGVLSGRFAEQDLSGAGAEMVIKNLKERGPITKLLG